MDASQAEQSVSSRGRRFFQTIRRGLSRGSPLSRSLPLSRGSPTPRRSSYDTPSFDRGSHALQAVSGTDVIFFHLLWRVLSRGSVTPHRPPLPDELIICIMGYARCIVPVPDLQITLSRPVTVHANSGTIRTERWFHVEFSRETLSKLAQMQLTTTSRHQGWVSLPAQGSWSWFEIGL